MEAGKASLLLCDPPQPAWPPGRLLPRLPRASAQPGRRSNAGAKRRAIPGAVTCRHRSPRPETRLSGLGTPASPGTAASLQRPTNSLGGEAIGYGLGCRPCLLIGWTVYKLRA